MNKKKIMLLSSLILLNSNAINAINRAEIFDVEDEIAINKLMEQLRRRETNQKTQAILARFAAIIMSFFGILQNPNDTQNVVENVTGMLTGAVQMVAEAVKAGELSLDATDEEIHAYATHLTRMMEPVLKTLSLEFE